MTTKSRWRAAFPVTGLAVAMMIWFGGMGAAAYLFDPSAVIVFAPAGTAVDLIVKADGNLLSVGRGYATGTSVRSGFVRRLYGQGAWFVWPALAHGCFAPGRFDARE